MSNSQLHFSAASFELDLDSGPDVQLQSISSRPVSIPELDYVSQ